MPNSPRACRTTSAIVCTRVQIGERPFPPSKPLNRGVLKGPGIHELCEDFDGDTYRAVYTVQLDGVVYVLHAFKKKSKSGIATPLPDIALIRSRYQDAVQAHARMLSKRLPPSIH